MYFIFFEIHAEYRLRVSNSKRSMIRNPPIAREDTQNNKCNKDFILRAFWRRSWLNRRTLCNKCGKVRYYDYGFFRRKSKYEIYELDLLYYFVCMNVNNWLVTIVSGPLSPERVMTQEAIIKALNVDMDQFIIQRCIVNKRDTSMRGEKWELIISENYQVKLFLLPKMTEDVKTIHAVLEDMLSKNTPEVAYLHKDIPNNGKMWSIFIADAHIDKLDIKWTPFKKKLHNLKEATKRLLDKIDRYGIEKLMYGNIGDYFNSDNSHKTTKWTPQENCVSELDAWKYGAELQIEILQIMKQIAHVTAIFAPGNHDWHKLQYLRDMCSVYFKNDENVDVMISDKERFYMPWWKTLIGVTHGANAKEKDLPGLAAVENKTRHRVTEIFKWHIHQDKKTQYPGAIVETLPAAWTPGQWEDNNWFWHKDPSIVWFVHWKKTGREAQFIEKI